jgi:hypothetical protein
MEVGSVKFARVLSHPLPAGFIELGEALRRRFRLHSRQEPGK